MMIETRNRFALFLGLGAVLGLFLACGSCATVGSPAGRAPTTASAVRVPVIDVTDLYHPYQDPGDNLDLIAGYALPEIDLRAVVLDCTQKFREPVADLPEYKQRDTEGPRDPGVIPVTQLNYIFNRYVPYGVGPFTRLESPADKKLDAPRFQQSGVELILAVLARSPEKVDILSFGSARPIAAAYNRNPGLMRAKVRRIHLSAGAVPEGYLEWNVMLDRNAIVCLLRSDLPIAIYPCATETGPFAYGRHNSFWSLPDLGFMRRMAPPLRNYCAFAFSRASRADFLRAMDEPPSEDVMTKMCARKHSVWETAIWMQAANRRLVRRADGHYRIIPAAEVRPDDKVLPNELRPCEVSVDDAGIYKTRLTDKPAHFWLYDRGDPAENENALREALPALYESFRVN